MTGVYIHLPFCATHCAYCPFVISTNMTLEDQYVAALLREIDARVPFDSIETLYLGGGTPSRTSVEHLARIASRFSVRTEFTLEANPEDVTAASIAAWGEMGVNRLSIGVQSFNDDELREIGRIHDAAAARDAIRLAVASGMRTNLDLILGLPHQSPDSFRHSLEEAIALGAGHLSL